MQGYGKQLSLKEIAAVVTYERNAWGNDTGDAVQASDVKSAVEGIQMRHKRLQQHVALTIKLKRQSRQSLKQSPVEDLTKVYNQDELMVMGEKVYMTACAACHQPTGAGLPPAFPALKGSAIAMGDITVHLDMVINGSKKNPAMAAFG